MCGFIIGLSAALLAIFSSEAMSAAAEAAALFTRAIMPALFPMLVLSSLPMRGSREPLFAVILFSLLAGSPAAARRVRGLYDAGGARDAYITALLGVTGVISPMFFLGALAQWSGRSDTAWRMLLVHWAGAALAGLIGGGVHGLRDAKGKKRRAARLGDVSATTAPGSAEQGGASRRRIALFSRTLAHTGTAVTRTAPGSAGQGGDNPAARTPPDSRALPIAQALPTALKAAAQSLLAICAAMMLFSIAAALVRAMLMLALPEWTAANAPLLAALWAALEIGGGTAELVRLGASPALVSAMCGFGGLSLWMQNLLFTADMTPPARLLALRAAHAGFSFALGSFLL